MNEYQPAPDPDLERVLRSTSIASLTFGAAANKRDKGKEKEKEREGKGKEKEKGKEKQRENEAIVNKNEFGQLIHTISATDTLEGIAVKYGVQVCSFVDLVPFLSTKNQLFPLRYTHICQPSELKRVNKLWTKGDMFARKYLIIPEVQDWGNSVQDLLWRFTSVTKCKEYEADLYLQRANFNFNEALRIYKEENAKHKTPKLPKRENGESTPHDFEADGNISQPVVR